MGVQAVVILVGDCVELMAAMPDASVDAVVTDPPYNLSFMAKPWDCHDGLEDAGFAYWLSGLIDGEGHFAIKQHTRGSHAPCFTMKMRGDEDGTLRLIQRTLKIGLVGHEQRDGHPISRWVVQDKEGCQRLVDLLDKYPLRAKKRIDYLTWREAVCEWTSRPRGNRWYGAADNTRMAHLRERLMETRRYVEPAWSGNEFQDWCRLWGREAYRVLRPGGHLLAFGGTRTGHRLVAGLEDAGFEIRDTLCWLYGSGFPKSLDVSKAIDKRRDDYEDVCAVALWLRPHVERVGFATVTAAFGFKDETMARARWTSRSQPQVPTWDQWLALKALCGFGDEMDAEVWRLNGRKGMPGEAWQTAEVVGIKEGAMSGWDMDGGTQFVDRDVKSPNSDDARRWQGWGTALKPAWESIVWAQKPAENGSKMDGSLCPSLSSLYARLVSLLDAKRAVELFSSSPVALEDVLASAQWDADDESNTRAALSALTDTSQSEPVLISSLSIVSSWLSTLAALLSDGSTSTTSTESSTTTDLKILSSSLSGLTPLDIIRAVSQGDGSTWNALPAARAFSAVASRLNATRELSAIESAIDAEPISRQGGVEPECRPIVVARKPLAGTVAANVLEHGTGAFNVDGCRVGDNPGYSYDANRNGTIFHGEQGARIPQTAEKKRQPTIESTQGRWPANVVLDEEAAAMLDEQTGELKSPKPYERGETQVSSERVYGGGRGIPLWSAEGNYGDSGGASRFFYVAKASRAERNAGLEASCVCGTVKPWDEREDPETSPLRDTSALTEEDGSDCSTSGSGSRPTDPSPPAFKSTTETESRRTTDSKTSSSSRPSTTSESTPRTSGEQRTEAGRGGAESVANGSPPPASTTTSAERDGSSTAVVDLATSAPSSRPSSSAEHVCPSCQGVIQGWRNSHPTRTVKPVSLMRWLLRLVTPPGGLVLDPFAGSGTTGVAAALEGFAFTGCEQDADYARIAEARIAWWAEHGEEALAIVKAQEKAEAEREQIAGTGQLDIFEATTRGGIA